MKPVVPIDQKRFWSIMAKSLGTEFRETSAIQGASGLTHDLQALCVDDKSKRLILFATESNPRVAALIQGDVQATFPDARVIVARIASFDLGVLVRSLFRSASGATMTSEDFTRFGKRLEAMSDSRKTALMKKGMLAPASTMLTAMHKLPLPVLDQLGSLVQQVSTLNWPEVFAALKPDSLRSGLSFTSLYNFDSQAIDVCHGICHLPLYSFDDRDWGLFEDGKDLGEVQASLKRLNIFQYFFPPPDQLALAVTERGVTNRADIVEIVSKSHEAGHPHGEPELVPADVSIVDLVDALTTRKYVADIERELTITKSGRKERLKIKATPREGVVLKLINRFKFDAKLHLTASTKDLWPPGGGTGG
jgi:hypothetical protein